MPQNLHTPLSIRDQALLSSAARTEHAEWRAATVDGRSRRRRRLAPDPATLRLRRWSPTLRRPARDGDIAWTIAEPRIAE